MYKEIEYRRCGPYLQRAYSLGENYMQLPHRVNVTVRGHEYHGDKKKEHVTPSLRCHGQFLRKDDASTET